MDITKAVSSFRFRVSSAQGPRFKATGNGRRGLWVVLLGPDGAGKSSVIEGLGSGVAAGFAGCETYHLRPSFLRCKRARAPNCNRAWPRGARGALISTISWSTCWSASWLGYLRVVRPRLSRGTLVLFDRYFPDCLVDPVRYRLPRSCRRLTAVGCGDDSATRPLRGAGCSGRCAVGAKAPGFAGGNGTPTQHLRCVGLEFRNVTVVDAARALPEVVNDVIERIIERHLAYHGRFELA